MTLTTIEKGARENRVVLPPGAAPSAESWRELPLLLAAFTVLWTLYATVTHFSGALHNDVMEAYVWGQEFQLGYNQHPPFWAWMAGTWFAIFPRANWAFALLAYLNAAVGLLGSWKLIGNFAGGETRRTATILLLLTPFYTFLALKYNANSIFLSVWPWTLHFFVRSLAHRRAGDAVAFGAMLAFALLSKYFAIILGLTCFIASLASPDRARYYGSRAPYITVIVAAAMCVPHALWLLQSDAPPFRYFASTTSHAPGASLRYALQVFGGALVFHALIAAVIVAGDPTAGLSERWRIARARWADPDARLLAMLVVVPLLLTLAAGLGFRLKLSTNMTMGIYSLAPLAMITFSPVRYSRRIASSAFTLASALTIGALVLSPAVAYATARFVRDPDNVEPRSELAGAATRLWTETVKRPLVFVAGSLDYPNALAFYSSERPHVFIDFDLRKSPWVSTMAVQQHGLLSICMEGDPPCFSSTNRYVNPQTTQVKLTLAHRSWGVTRRPVSFVVTMIPPQS